MKNVYNKDKAKAKSKAKANMKDAVVWWKIKYRPSKGLVNEVWRDSEAAMKELNKTLTWNVVAKTEKAALDDFRRWNHLGGKVVGKPEKHFMSKAEYENG